MKSDAHVSTIALWLCLACVFTLPILIRANEAHAAPDRPAHESTAHGSVVEEPKTHSAPAEHAPAEHAAAEPEHAPSGETSAGAHEAKDASHGESAEPPVAHESTSPEAGAEGASSHSGESVHGGHGAAKAHQESPEALLRKKRQVDADSGMLSGELPRNLVVWKRTSKPLRLLSDVVVGPGQILEIGPGVEVRVAARDRAPLGSADWADSQLVSLIVRGGTLRIAGTGEKPVRFVPEKAGKGPRWGGIAIEDTRSRTQVDLAWIEVPGALQGISFERAAGSVRHAVVLGGNVGLRMMGGSAPEVLQSVISGQQVAGLISEKSGPLVRGCLFLGNVGVGARFEGVGLVRLENNDFWNNAGGDLVRPPPAVGGWTSDSVVPDRFGNVRADPVLRSSKLHARLLAQREDSLRSAPIWRRRLPDPPPGSGPWALSPFSPLLDRGSISPLCRDTDGSKCDIGLWGGKD